MYVSCGRMGDAMKVFDEMRDGVSVVVGNMVMKGWCKDGNVDMGMRVFRGMRVRSVVSWNTILSCLAKSGREREALGMFREMLDDGVEGDEGTVVSMLPVCARLGEDGVGEWIHAFAKSSGVYEKYVSVRNSVVDFYCKRGRLDDAFLVFENMPGKNVVSWNAMISGLAFNGDGEKGLALFDEMIKKGFKPNESTFVGVLTCCVHSGLFQRGKDLFALMVSKHHVEPKLEHYGCMVDLLGRGGLVKEAFDLVKSMPMKPNAALWGALLSSCRDHGYMEIAEVAVKELIVLEPWNSGNYVVLSNMYAERGKWDEVEKVRVLMSESNIEKNQGQSLIR
ncbi:Pentatricopeptide repeat-containing protein [Artemisia annua]|uniref:Pentatricopeptide repeat-containing protein n=1 Tax=Artemisia annua TaxID=35608 RepID=A0A2U1M1J5_ARTAN|nr:Pentatricopeptide repeat-containing protein [Artemisia annua]